MDIDKSVSTKTSGNYFVIFTLISSLSLLQFPAYSQTTITHRKVSLYKKDYVDCMVGSWELDIPKFAVTSAKDVRVQINRQVQKFVRALLEDSKNFNHNDPKKISPDCDTTSSPFTLPYGSELQYKVYRNTRSFLSVEVFMESYAGGGGNGFGTEYYSFNVDLLQNKMISVKDLFLKSKTKQLAEIIKQKFNDDGIELGMADFEVFGSPGDDVSSRCRFTGFVIDSKNLTFKYSVDYGRGNGIIGLEIPLSVVKTYINSKYFWLLP